MIVVAGARGQLGSMLQKIVDQPESYVFLGSDKLDITDPSSVSHMVDHYKPDVIINCAAYTAVDKAEEEEDKAFSVNATGIKNLAEAVADKETLIIHISTDYVYHNEIRDRGIVEGDDCRPVGAYARSKYAGEEHLKRSGARYVIVRTSWLYSEMNKNFMKTMLALSEKYRSLKVVDDQVGSPTYARDLAMAVVKIAYNWLQAGKPEWKKVYNFSNRGAVSWCEFAKTIFDVNQIYRIVTPISTEAFGAPAARPAWSVLDTSAIEREQGVYIRDWVSRLKNALLHYENYKEHKN